ncbi:MAG: hypothetical protein OHK0039_16270 [Bacteroidia bacterium]
MAKRNRDTLTGFFRGAIPPTAYGDLIESTFNLLDDGMDVDKDNGLRISAKGPSQRLISFYELISDKVPVFSLSLKAGDQEGLHLQEGGRESRLFLKKGGNLGVGMTDPAFTVDVKGVVGMEGRAGTFAKGYIPADGQWHILRDNLHGCMAFEVLAHINDDTDGRYALTYAILLLASGKRGSRKEVNMVRAGSRWFWGRIFNRINFRWRIDENNTKKSSETRYMIQMRSRTHYGLAGGKPKPIFYRMMRLWDRNFESNTYVAPDLSSTSNVSTPANPTTSGGDRPSIKVGGGGGISIKPK